jgi:hypothetical protein
MSFDEKRLFYRLNVLGDNQENIYIYIFKTFFLIHFTMQTTNSKKRKSQTTLHPRAASKRLKVADDDIYTVASNALSLYFCQDLVQFIAQFLTCSVFVNEKQLLRVECVGPNILHFSIHQWNLVGQSPFQILLSENSDIGVNHEYKSKPIFPSSIEEKDKNVLLLVTHATEIMYPDSTMSKPDSPVEFCCARTINAKNGVKMFFDVNVLSPLSRAMCDNAVQSPQDGCFEDIEGEMTPIMCQNRIYNVCSNCEGRYVLNVCFCCLEIQEGCKSVGCKQSELDITWSNDDVVVCRSCAIEQNLAALKETDWRDDLFLTEFQRANNLQQLKSFLFAQIH